MKNAQVFSANKRKIVDHEDLLESIKILIQEYALLLHTQFKKVKKNARPINQLNTWPKLMKTTTAAAYCDLSKSSFESMVDKGIMPQPVSLRLQKMYLRDEIDRAIESKSNDTILEVFQ